MHLDPVRWLQEKARKAQDDKDAAQLLQVFKKMLAMAHGRSELLIQAHQGLADAYGLLGDHARMRKHQRECFALEASDEAKSQSGITWVGDEDRLLDYEDYLRKKPLAVLTFREWKALDDEMLLLLAWSNLRDLKPMECARLKNLAEVLLVE